MGSSFAPSAANLFMDAFEQQHILSSDQNPYFKYIFKSFRYIGDIFCVYTDIDLYEDFLKWINNLHPTIKFAGTKSTDGSH